MLYVPRKELKTVGDRVCCARERRGMGQKELAKLSGVSQPNINKLEKNIHRSSKALLKIARALGVNYVWLQEGTGTMEIGMEAEGADYGLAPEAVTLARKWAQLPSEGRAAIVEIIDLMHNASI